MVGLDWVGLRILCCIREWRVVEDLWGRRNIGGNNEGLDAEASPKMLVSFPILVGLDIPLIPREPKWVLGHLDHKEVEIGIRRQPAGVDRHVFGSSRRHYFDPRCGSRNASIGADHVKRDLITLLIAIIIRQTRRCKNKW